MRRDVFQAIADPTRREIITLLGKGRLNLNNVTDNFTISRPAISKHIKILTECGLLHIKQEGRERFCEVQFDKLNEVSVWIDHHRQFWLVKLDNLNKFLQVPDKRTSSKFIKKTK